MEAGRRALWLHVLLASAMVAVSFIHVDAAATAGQAAAGYGPGPDTTMLCVSKCGTCPTVCSPSPSPPPPPSEENGGGAQPGTPSGGCGGCSSSSRSTSPPGQQGKGGHPSSYYYFFTAGSGRRAGPSGCATVLALLVTASLAAAGFQ